MDSQLGRKLAAEFVGTFTLIFIGAGSIIVGSGIVGVAIDPRHVYVNAAS